MSEAVSGAVSRFETAGFFPRGMNPWYAKICAMSQERRALDANALAVMIALTALWGFQQVTIKWIAADVSLVAQAGIRSIVATVLLLAWARVARQSLFEKDATLGAGIAAGLLFAFEFVLIYGGLAYTNASRMSVFVYLAPPLTALGLHFFVAGERLGVRQWLGVALAFGGLVLAFAEGFSAGRSSTWIGDFCGLLAAILWAATTVLIRATNLARVSAAKTLFYQLAVSALALPVASFLLGEKGVSAVNGLVLASLAYQAILVAFASYLAWFWLLTRYLAARISVLSFLTPLFGMVFGVLFLSEPLSAYFAAAALLIAAGIALVNFRG
jgi:drug/metabolite transporter (DMT)-like permease